MAITTTVVTTDPMPLRMGVDGSNSEGCAKELSEEKGTAHEPISSVTAVPMSADGEVTRVVPDASNRNVEKNRKVLKYLSVQAYELPTLCLRRPEGNSRAG